MNALFQNDPYLLHDFCPNLARLQARLSQDRPKIILDPSYMTLVIPVKSKSEPNILPLSNGVRLAHKQIKQSNIVHCAIMFDLGSRDEQNYLTGIAHFWEHLAFKGTNKRKSFQILNRIDALGGELNAFTTKEKVCFHASVLAKHAEIAIELLADIAFESIFPEKEVEKEIQVVLEEMAMYLDTPDDAIQDDFDTLLYGKHALGNNILGTKESIQAFNREELIRFREEQISAEGTIFSIVGGINIDKAHKLVEKHIGERTFKGKRKERKAPSFAQGLHLKETKKITQSHCMLGGPAYSLNDDRRLPFFTLTNLLGGPAMNSRLNVSLRENHGLVYGIDAMYTTLQDVGMFAIYFGTDVENLPKCEKLIRKELDLLMDKTLSPVQLNKIKHQLRGQLAMSEEHNQGFMLMMAKSVLDTGKVESVKSIFEKIDLIQAANLQGLAQEAFDPKKLNSLTFIGKGED